jgi:hypothetical protein
MWCKHDEYLDAHRDRQYFIDNLRETAKKFEEHLSIDDVEHCALWADALARL